jgi:hypothetical protein
MTIPALQQPIALIQLPATAQNAQFGGAPPGIASERSAVPNGGSRSALGCGLLPGLAAGHRGLSA